MATNTLKMTLSTPAEPEKLKDMINTAVEHQLLDKEFISRDRFHRTIVDETDHFRK